VPLLLVAAGAAVYRVAKPLLEARDARAPGPSSPTARVLKAFDGDTLLVLVGGVEEKVRLVGVDTPELARDGRPDQAFAREAASFAGDLAAGKTVTLETDPMARDRDRYGRLLRYVILADRRILGIEIVRQGYGFAYTRSPYSRMEEFLRLENEAREAGAGLWAPDRVPSISWREAPKYIGEAVLVEGTIVRTHDTGKIRFLNFHEDYRRHLSLVIFARDAKRFPGDPCELYEGSTVEVRGRVTEFRGRPQIVISFPEQIGVKS
jgi:micrococcal nuclease